MVNFKNKIQENYHKALCCVHDYIFNPGFLWPEEWKFENKISCISGCYNILGYYYILTLIKDLSYKEFLSTLYWSAISEKIKRDNNYTCELCGSSHRVQTHHKTYKHFGYEIYNLSDLICLCSECHSKFHDKIK